MNADEKYAKLLALSVLYEKDEQSRDNQVRRIYCNPTDVPELLDAICHNDFREWVASVTHLFRSTDGEAALN